MNILIINGPNLNMLGIREPEIYGKEILAGINKKLADEAKKLKAEVEFFQSNCEGAIIDKIQSFYGEGLIINAGAYTHYSYAIRDALKILTCKKIEVHMSNIYSREEFRHTSVLSAVCDGTICGFGSESYSLALHYLANQKV